VRGRLVRRVLGSFALLAAAALVVPLLSVVAGAHDSDLVDPNDTRGSLDVRQVRLAHQPGPPQWTIVTFEEWRTAAMWDRGYLMVLLDTEGGAGAEYYLLVRSAGTVLQGSLWRVRATGPDSFVDSVPTKRFSRRSATVQVGLARLVFGPRRTFYRWWVQTVFTSDICRRTCHDRAPNGESILQWRPRMSPSPSPSSSSSTTPAPTG
jgi:hypothetical protein